MTGAAWMAFGKGLLGGIHTDISTVIGIIEIVLIARLLKGVPKKQNNQPEVG
ncbi:MAG: hypothetical protein ACUVV4_02520 [Candidatus Bathyarchaeia archaeon]